MTQTSIQHKDDYGFITIQVFACKIITMFFV